MQVELHGIPQTATVHAQPLLVEGDGATLVVTIAADEQLAAASLALSPPQANPSFSAPVLATDKGASFDDVTWVSADWGTTRSLASVSLPALGRVGAVRVRLSIARGSSGWYSPPGPHSFTLADGPRMSLHASLPDTVADRVMLEFFSPTGDQESKALTLTAAPVFGFGPAARDLSVAVTSSSVSGLQREGQVFAFAGVPEREVAVPELIEALRRMDIELRGPCRIKFEIAAGAAGLVGLAWSFVIDRITSSFAGPLPGARVSRALAWDGVDEVPLARRGGPNAERYRVEALELHCQHVPVRERLAFAPDPDLLGEALGELLRPSLESAQRFELSVAGRLTGASIWARPLTAVVELEAALHADQAGAPAVKALATATLDLHNPEFAHMRPRWIDLDFAAPVDVAAGPLWLVIGCKEGELSWLIGQSESPGELRQRRNGGAWLSRVDRVPHAWALLRIRELELGEHPSPTLELVLRDRANDPDLFIPLTIDADGRVRYTAAQPVDADAAGEVLVRVRCTSPGLVHLSGLQLRWRPVLPQLSPNADVKVV